MLRGLFILRAKGQSFDGYRIIARNVHQAKGDAEHMFDLKDIDYHIEITGKLAEKKKEQP